MSNAASQQGELYFTKARMAIRALPSMPSSLRYLDEYTDEYRSIQKPNESDIWQIIADTKKAQLDFSNLPPDESLLSKHFFSWLLSRSSPATVLNYAVGFYSLTAREKPTWLFEAIERLPNDWLGYWNRQVVHACSQEEALFCKLFLYFMCEMAIGEFRSHHRNFVESLPFHWRDNGYQGVINGDSVITVAQERAIIDYLDETSEKLSINKQNVEDVDLVRSCLLCISYQHGLRPVQICRIELSDLRFYLDEKNRSIVHFTAYRAKKRSATDKTPFTRRIKQDWVPLFVEYWERRKHGPVWQNCEDSEKKLFTITKAELIRTIGDVVEQVTGVRSTATNLRHAAAQRMADNNASVEEVAEFLGHSHLDTSLIYFQSSPSQAERLNAAMGASPIYSKIAEIARTGFIDKKELINLPEDNQIGGIPHGIPITGIGACGLGQSLCAKNPVLSCYTCRKFIPVSEPETHRQVLSDLQSVVRFFFDEARGGLQSQAYTQLESTLQSVQNVIASIGHEPSKANT